MSGTGPGRAPARPRQVTIAGVMATVACLLLLVGLFDAMSQVRSTETQSSVRDFLSTPPGSSLGLGVDGVVDLLRGVVLLSGALAAAGTILAVYSLRRHRGARVGLSVVAVLMLFSTTFVAGLLPFVVALAASMLWRREARDWFDGRDPQPRAGSPRPSAPPPVPPVPPAGWPPPHTGGQPDGHSEQPVPAPPYQSAPPPAQHAFGAPPAAQQPAEAWPPPVYAAPRAEGRPAAVTAAAWLTWVFSGLTVLVLMLLVLTLLTQQEQLVSELQKTPDVAAQGYTSDEILRALWVLSAVGIFWSLAAMALAGLAFHRARAGRVGLVVSAAAAGVLGVVSIVGIPHGIAALATVGLLLRGSANRWYAGARPPGAPPQDRPPQQPPRDSGRPPVW